MFKNLAILFIVCYPLYVFYSRQPDYSDAQFSFGNIHYAMDSATKTILPKANFIILHKTYTASADYAFTNYTEGQKVKIIYNNANPSNAAVCTFWGYWLRWKELLAALILLFVMYQAAVSITANPTPEAILEELENSKPTPKPRKYKD